jgi:hypothetical protein
MQDGDMASKSGADEVVGMASEIERNFAENACKIYRTLMAAE